MAGFLQTLKNIFFPEREEGRDPVTRYLLLTLLGAAVFAALAYWFYNRTHTFDSYRIRKEYELHDTEGTQYRMLSGRLIKYGHDGLFCVNLKNETLWSTAYTMQTPVADVSGGIMAIAEQQGNQVYVLNSKGVLGSFTTSMPVMKIRAASNGVVALVLNDTDNTTWIELRSAAGEQIASVKATQTDSGYPMDIALSSNARQLLVSYLGEAKGELVGKIALYDFSSADASDESHLLALREYPGVIFPDVFFSGSGPVAVANDGYIAFSSGKNMEEVSRLTLNDEIVSEFHDGRSIGFVFRSGRSDVKYHMTVYNLRGRSTMETDLNFEYADIRMEDSEILLYDSGTIYVYRTSGRQKVSTAYEKPVKYFTHTSGLRNYLVISSDGIDQIRVY